MQSLSAQKLRFTRRMKQKLKERLFYCFSTVYYSQALRRAAMAPLCLEAGDSAVSEDVRSDLLR